MAVDQEGGMGEGTLVAMPAGGGGGSQGEDSEKSLAAMLRSQYLSREFNDVYSATELRESEIPGLCGAFATRFFSLIMSTEDDDLVQAEPEEKKSISVRLGIKRRIYKNPNAAVFVLEDAWLYAFGLCRQSLKRQSRHEAAHISTANILRSMGVDGGDIGFGQRLLSKVGIGQYRTAFIPKQMEK